MDKEKITWKYAKRLINKRSKERLNWVAKKETWRGNLKIRVKGISPTWMVVKKTIGNRGVENGKTLSWAKKKIRKANKAGN